MAFLGVAVVLFGLQPALAQETGVPAPAESANETSNDTPDADRPENSTDSSEPAPSPEASESEPTGSDPAPEEPPPPETAIDCSLLYETADGLFVDVGSEVGIQAGQVGRLRDTQGEIGRIEVVQVATGSTFLRIDAPGSRRLEPGVRLTLLFEGALQEQSAPEQKPSETLRDPNESQNFEPLLAPPNLGELAETQARNVFQGKLRLRHFFQTDPVDTMVTRLGTSGSLQRIDGSPWALEWDADVVYRDGDALQFIDGHEEVRLELFQLSAFRRFDNQSSVQVGRFLPLALPSVGYIDGFQGEKVVSSKLRFGTIIGWRPKRRNLEFSVKEPTLVPYLTMRSGEDADFQYSGTAGVLMSLYEGDPDRLAILWDQRAQIGKLLLLSSSEIDFDSGQRNTRRAVELTRFDLTASYPVSPGFRIRGGIDRFELPDTDAERDAVPVIVLPEREFFEQGFWRYWIGASHQLSENWTLSEEVSYNDSDDFSDDFFWSAQITRRGLFGMPRATATFHAYNLAGDGAEGVGARLSGYFPTANHRFFLQPSVAFRYADFDTGSEDFEVADVAIRSQWVLSPSWSFQGGLSYAVNQDDDRVFVDVGVTLRW